MANFRHSTEGVESTRASFPDLFMRSKILHTRYQQKSCSICKLCNYPNTPVIILDFTGCNNPQLLSELRPLLNCVSQVAQMAQVAKKHITNDDIPTLLKRLNSITKYRLQSRLSNFSNTHFVMCISTICATCPTSGTKKQ